MNKISNALKAFFAIATMVVSFSSFTGRMADVTCSTTVTTPTGTYTPGSTSFPTEGEDVSTASTEQTNVPCDGEGRFCCAKVTADKIAVVFFKGL
jgi:hypothetical protein